MIIYLQQQNFMLAENNYIQVYCISQNTLGPSVKNYKEKKNTLINMYCLMMLSTKGSEYKYIYAQCDALLPGL